MHDNNNLTFYIYILFALFHLHSYTTGLPCNQKKTATSKDQRSKCRKRKRSCSVSDESNGEEWQPWKEEEEKRRRMSTRKTGGKRERGTEGGREKGRKKGREREGEEIEKEEREKEREGGKEKEREKGRGEREVGRKGERERRRQGDGKNEDYMEGAEAGRRKRWRKEGEIIERK